MKPFRTALVRALLSWTLLSEMVGPGIGPGVSKDFKPLRQEEGTAYRYEERTRLEYDNAESERTKDRRKNDALFERFYRSETNPPPLR